MNRKLIFFDIDGTIIPEDTGVIPESTKEAIKKAKENGHLVFINTGRTFSGITQPIFDLEFNGYVCGCGTHIYFDGKKFEGNVIYTGALDELFACCYGRLPYRSLRFEFEYYDKPDYQGHSVVNYTVSEDYTRITEFKYLTGQQADGTTIVKEYPFAYSGAEGEIPYYAILNEENQSLYEKYKALTGKYPNMHLLGRLAEYKYYNIDAMTEKALELTKELLK